MGEAIIIFLMSAKKPPLNGARISRNSASNSKPNRRNKRLDQLLRQVFHQYQKFDDPLQQRQSLRDFVFHMTDWESDLRKLAQLYDHPERFDADNAGDIVSGFLLHALAHVQAASELMLDYQGFSFPKRQETVR